MGNAKLHRILRFRMGSHHLSVEEGRHFNMPRAGYEVHADAGPGVLGHWQALQLPIGFMGRFSVSLAHWAHLRILDDIFL